MDDSLRARLTIPMSALEEVNRFLLDPDNPVINAVIRIVEKYGTPKEINYKARKARQLPCASSTTSPRPRRASSGDMPDLERNYLDKHAAVNCTAQALTD